MTHGEDSHLEPPLVRVLRRQRPGRDRAATATAACEIGDSDYWIGDYTIEPENGGVGVFAHEFAHDLGLPDLYDTSGNTGGAENSTGFWTLMSSGSYGNSGKARDGIGTKPVPHRELGDGSSSAGSSTRSPSGSRSSTGSARRSTTPARRQGVFVVLPDREVPLELGAPCSGCGTQYFYSGSGDNLNNTMTRAVTTGGPLTAKVRYDIEEDWDYAFLEVSSDGGTTWTPVATNRSDERVDGPERINTSRTGCPGRPVGDVGRSQRDRARRDQRDPVPVSRRTVRSR